MPDETVPHPRPDLELVATEDLWQEIRRRCDAAILIYELNPRTDSCQTGVNYWGSIPHCLGLAQYAESKLGRKMEEWLDQQEADGRAGDE